MSGVNDAREDQLDRIEGILIRVEDLLKKMNPSRVTVGLVPVNNEGGRVFPGDGVQG